MIMPGVIKYFTTGAVLSFLSFFFFSFWMMVIDEFIHSRELSSRIHS